MFRTEKVGREAGCVWVYRLASLEEASTAPGLEELRDHCLEASRASSHYTCSSTAHSSLRLAIIVGRKIIIYRWKHAEEWITFTDDTVAGFELVTEIQCVEVPQVLTLLEQEREGEVNRMVLIGNKKGFHLVSESSHNEVPVIGFKSGEVPIMGQVFTH